MKKLNFLAGLVVVIALSSCGSKPYKVERKIEVRSSSEAVFNRLGDNKNRGDWSPWDKLDPEMKKTYEGPNSGVGAKYSWSSENENVGTGTLECVESNPYSYIKSNLTFTAPWESSSVVEWNITEGQFTEVSWSVSGELPGMAALFTDMEETLGPQLEEGLGNLKKLCEEETISKPNEVVEEQVQDSTLIDSSAVAIEEGTQK